MKKFIFISILFCFIAGHLFFSCNSKPQPPEQLIAQTLLVQTDSFAGLIRQLQVAVENHTSSQKKLQNLFLQARLAYKRIEWAAEYFEPAAAKLTNGPPVQEVEMPGLQVIEPAGLQVIEGLIFPTYDTTRKGDLLSQLQILQTVCERYKIRFSKIQILDWQVFDALKLEIFRIMTLGIVGFDNPLTLKSMQESALSMESMQNVIAKYEDGDIEGLGGKFRSAIEYLSVNPGFDSFNRMEFITELCNPITIGISDLGERRKIQFIRYNRLLNQDAKTLFDTNAFNVNAYAPDHSSFISEEKIILGQKLFADPVLSGNGKRSCQSCHQPDKAFTDGLAKNTVIGGNELLGRNTPTLINAALQPALFYDLRVNTLEDQSHSVVQSNKEMHGSMVMSGKYLWKDEQYRAMFLKAFPYEDKTRIDTFEIMNAIGSYIRSLVQLNSRFDKYMRGDKAAMNPEEINGFNLFMGKAKCATCHYLPLFNGTFPPRFNKIESEVIAVPEKKGSNIVDPDLGRFEIIKVESLRHAFKTPTVRNAARTAPYMHNGVFGTLEEVMDFYNKGGGAGMGIKVDNQTLPADSLNLTIKDQTDIVSFIKSLDSKFPAD